MISLALSAAVAVVACGGRDEAATETTTAVVTTMPATTGPAATTAAPAVTTAPAEAASTTAPATTEPQEAPAATEIGVTESEIVIGVVADVDNPIAPGLSQPLVDAMVAWGEYVNDNGGLAGRQVTVKFYDSKLNPDESTNAVTAACGEAFALVGSGAFVLLNQAPLVECQDAAGEVTGLPDLAALTITDATMQSPTSFGVIRAGRDFSLEGDVWVMPVSEVREVENDLGVDSVTGIVVHPGVPGSAAGAGAVTAAFTADGATMEAPIAFPDAATQAEATPIVQQIKNNGINYVWAQSFGVAKIMAEAQIQGVDMASVAFSCTTQCFSPVFVEQAGDVIEGLNVQSLILPWTDIEIPAVQAYRDFVPAESVSSNGMTAWAQGLAFQELVEQLVATDGINALTRANLLELIHSGAPVTGGGILPPDFSYTGRSACHVWNVVGGGEFKRLNPSEPGEFACDDTALVHVDGPFG